MKRCGMIWLGGVVACCAAWARADGPTQPDRPLGERLGSIRADQAEASRVYHLGLDAAKGDPERDRVVGVFLGAVARNSDRALALAEERPGDPAALEALAFVLGTARAGPGRQSERAIDLLRRDHVRDPAIGDACWTLFIFSHLRAAEDLLRAVVADNPDERSRGLASDVLADYLIAKAKLVRKLKTDPARVATLEGAERRGLIARMVRDAEPEALEADARVVLRRIIASYHTVRMGKNSLGEIAAGKLRDLEGLRVGEPAPEIEGVDAEGTRLRLSDYRGKVVLLTFSGEWCGPCRAFYPHERDLVRRLAGEPFVALSVNTDADPEPLRRAIASGSITWRCWRDGATDGPITTAWGIQSFPTLYLIDPRGIIRAKHPDRDEVDAAIDALIAQAKADRPAK